jgi:hypothetical protein
MPDDVLMRLTDRLMTDAQFRTRARADLDAALRDGGFQLSEDELAAVRAFHREAAGLGEAELDAALSDGARRRQFGGS